jgi:negative regulator of flagellin synthesis FlgM
MAMKINDIGRISAFRSYQQISDQRTGSAAGKRRKDEVAFSQEAMELLKARKGLDDAQRMKRIEQLKAEVSAGTYYVPDHLLAEKLLPFVR